MAHLLVWFIWALTMHCYYRLMISFGWLQLWEAWGWFGFSVAAPRYIVICASDSKSCKRIKCSSMFEGTLWSALGKNVPHFLVLFVWFWKCRFSGRGRRENWKQTHSPWRASLSMKSISVQRMRRHKTTVPHCISEGNQHSQTERNGRGRFPNSVICFGDPVTLFPTVVI